MPQKRIPRRASTNGVSARLKQLRDAFAIRTQTEMAARIGVKVDRYRKAETTGVLSTGLALALIGAFGVTRDWLYDGNPGNLTLSVANRLGELPMATENQSRG